jgi:triphosphoribosyl-dephospho-CoA synthase
MTPHSPPLTPGACATLACLWEATASKPGNVHRGADFDDVGYADFLTSAVAIGPAIDAAARIGVGAAVRQAVEATQAAVGSNTNLGMVLLLAPLAAVPAEQTLGEGVEGVLAGLSVADCAEVYEAIRAAKPGGLGTAPQADVHEAAPNLTLRQAMQLAADRDTIALQYANGFREVFLTADRIAAALGQGQALGAAVIDAYLRLLAERPDTLIARKCGGAVAAEASLRASRALDWLAQADDNDECVADVLADLDFWLRSDGHRRNPGTTADLIAAGLFVLLRDGRLAWPVRFY